MTLEEIDKLAYIGQELPEDNSSRADWFYWQAMRYIYGAQDIGIITVDAGKKMKNQARDQYSAYLSDQRLGEFTAKMWARIEFAAMVYRQDKTLENADAFMNAVYGTYQQAQEVIS